MPEPRPRVLVTGLGVVSPIGIGAEAFAAGLLAGRSAFGPITGFDPGSARTSRATEILDLEPEDILGAKGLRNLSRSTKLALCAARLALDDAGLAVTQHNRGRLGAVMGAGLGCEPGYCAFLLDAMEHGVRAASPGLFAHAVHNALAASVALRFGLRGVNATVASGYTAALECLDYAADQIRLGHADALLVGGAHELERATYLGFDAAAGLARGVGAAPCCRPFDRRRDGTLLGEGAAVLVLESEAHALARGREALAEYLGGAARSDPAHYGGYDASAEVAAAAYRAALDDGGVASAAVDCVVSGASGLRAGDAVEANALAAALGAGGSPIVATAPKSMLGETFSASGALQTATALVILTRDEIPPTINYAEPDPQCALDCVPGTARPLHASIVMVTCASPMGQHAAVVLARPGGPARRSHRGAER